MRLRTLADPAQVRPRRRRRLLGVGLALTLTLQAVCVTGPARASNRSGLCEDIPFADRVCGAVDSAVEAYDFASDPLGYIAQHFRDAVAGLFAEMVNALVSTTTVDWGDPGFLRTYSMAFAASSVLTVILWLIAAAKRALQGVAPLQAVTESIGYLLMSVAASALAPAAVAYVTQMFDQAAEAMFAPVASDAASMAATVTTATTVLLTIPGGPIIVTFLSLGLLTGIAGVWMELIVRDALILSGLVFGTSVFSGLVDRNLWGHVKRWVGVMGAVIASRYVTLTTLALATGMLASDGSGEPSVGQSFATVFTAIALLWLALYLPFQLSKFLPLLGDEIQGMYQARDDFKGRAQRMGSQVGDTFDELKNRFGGGGGGTGGADGGEGGEGGEASSQAGAEEAAATSTGVGAVAVVGKKAVEAAQDEAKKTAERSVEAASGEGGDGDGDGDRDDVTEAAPDTSAGSSDDGVSAPEPPTGAPTGTAPHGTDPAERTPEAEPSPQPPPKERPDPPQPETEPE